MSRPEEISPPEIVSRVQGNQVSANKQFYGDTEATKYTAKSAPFSPAREKKADVLALVYRMFKRK
jgi:hypothetical protein